MMQSKKNTKAKRKAQGLLVASPFLLPSLIGLLVFSMLPLVISGVISLTDWNGLDPLMDPAFLETHYIGLANYQSILTSAEFWKALTNTGKYIILYIPLMLMASLLVAQLLSRPRRGVGVLRVLYYIPVLTSWVAASLIWKTVLSPQYGALNSILAVFGIQGPGWLLDEAWAMPAIVLVSVWKDMGFFGLILLSGLVAIDRTYYEAASIDGASRLQKIWNITLPGIKVTVVLVATLNVANVLNAGFDQIYNMYSPIVYQTGDIIDTYVYRMSFESAQYSLATAVGLLKSVVSFILIVSSNFLARKFANYRIF